MTKLNNQTILVAGGSGQVGEGIVRQLLNAGAQVIVPSRNTQKLVQLRKLLDEPDEDRLITIEGSIGTVEGAEAIRDAVGEVHHVIASLGGWWQGKPLVDIDMDLWRRLLDNSLTAHFITAKTFLPVLPEGASYTIINGGATLHPVPNAAPISVSAAAQTMLGRTIATENKHIRANVLVLATPVLTRDRPQGQDGWLSADDAGRYCVYLASDANTQSGEVIIFDDPESVLA
ncbi:MAG: SDR family oxidoreductase [Chloroflexota bacterium]